MAARFLYNQRRTMFSSGQRLLGGSRALLRGVLAVYVLAAAFMPLGHHDIACHLKSTTHCSTCVVGSSGESPSHTAPLCGIGLDDAGAAFGIGSVHLGDIGIRSSSGRSPPLA